MDEMSNECVGRVELGSVIPTQAGIQSVEEWIPAQAGMTSSPKMIV
jgi:hypothetical protein